MMKMIFLIFWNSVLSYLLVSSIDSGLGNLKFAAALLIMTAIEVFCWASGYLEALDYVDDEGRDN